MKIAALLLFFSTASFASELNCLITDGTQTRSCVKKVQCFTLYENEPKTSALCDKNYSVATENYVDTVLIRVVDNKTRKDVVRTTRDTKDLNLFNLALEKPKVSVSCTREVPKECAEPVKKP